MIYDLKGKDVMFCNKCGKEINPTDRFCPSCGEPQMDNTKPDSEFRRWLTKRRMLWTITGAVLVVFGVVIRKPQIAMVGAIISTISLLALNTDK